MVVRLLCVVAIPAVAIALWFWLDPKRIPRTAGPWDRPLAERRTAPFPRELVLASGERIAVQAPAQRIVSGTVFSDEVLLAICPPERIAALHTLSTDARWSSVANESKAFPRHHSGEPEQILALQPDAVIVSSFSRVETRNLLSRVGCAVLRFENFSSVADVCSNLRALGWSLGLDDAAEGLVQQLDATLTQVALGKDQRRAWRILHWEDGRASGSSTTFDSLLDWIGARNATRELGWQGSLPITAEQALALDPDALVLGAAGDDVAALRDRLRQIPGFPALKALQRDRLLWVPPGWLQSTSHYVGHAAAHIANQLDRWGHP